MGRKNAPSAISVLRGVFLCDIIHTVQSAGDLQLLGKQFGYAAGSGPALLPRHAGNGVATLMHAQGKGVGHI